MVKSKFILEKKFYNEDATEEEIQAIKERVYLYEPHIVFLDEIPQVTPFSIKLVFDQIEILGADLGTHGILIDVSNTKPPDAVTRRYINQRFAQLCEVSAHVGFCSGKNVLMNTLIKFVMYQTNLKSFSIHRTLEGAVQSIKNVIDNDK